MSYLSRPIASWSRGIILQHHWCSFFFYKHQCQMKKSMSYVCVCTTANHGRMSPPLPWWARLAVSVWCENGEEIETLLCMNAERHEHCVCVPAICSPWLLTEKSWNIKCKKWINDCSLRHEDSNRLDWWLEVGPIECVWERVTILEFLHTNKGELVCTDCWKLIAKDKHTLSTHVQVKYVTESTLITTIYGVISPLLCGWLIIDHVLNNYWSAI